MPRRKAVPKVKYVQVKNLDKAALEAAFDFLFQKFIEQERAKNKKTKTPGKL